MYIYSIMGYGKAKTESGLGMIVRAIANNHKVLLAQFLKDGNSSEFLYLKDKIDCMASGTKGILLPKNKTEEDINDINLFYKEVFNQINNKEYDLVVLDEILVALDMGIISYAMLKLLIQTCRDKDIDMYMTGRVRDRHTREYVTDISDCVTDAYCIKHPFDTYCEKCKNSFPYYYTYCPDCGSELTPSRPCKEGRDF